LSGAGPPWVLPYAENRPPVPAVESANTPAWVASRGGPAD
jgi:hypothetical protein